MWYLTVGGAESLCGTAGRAGRGPGSGPCALGTTWITRGEWPLDMWLALWPWCPQRAGGGAESLCDTAGRADRGLAENQKEKAHCCGTTWCTVYTVRWRLSDVTKLH